MTDDNNKLIIVLEAIENFAGLEFLSFPRVLGFGGQAEFDVCDLIDRAGPRPWRSVTIDTCDISSRIDYEPGYGAHWGEILFHINDKKDLVAVLDPEVPVGLIFQRCNSNVIEKTESWRRDFYYSIEWRKDNYTEEHIRSYIDKWSEILMKNEDNSKKNNGEFD